MDGGIALLPGSSASINAVQGTTGNDLLGESIFRFFGGNTQRTADVGRPTLPGSHHQSKGVNSIHNLNAAELLIAWPARHDRGNNHASEAAPPSTQADVQQKKKRKDITAPADSTYMDEVQQRKKTKHKDTAKDNSKNQRKAAKAARREARRLAELQNAQAANTDSHGHAKTSHHHKVRVQKMQDGSTAAAIAADEEEDDDDDDVLEVTNLRTKSLIELITDLPVEIVEQHLWPQLNGSDRYTFKCTNKAAYQYAIRHFLRRIKVHMDQDVVSSGSLPPLYTPPEGCTAATALDITCNLLPKNGWETQQRLQHLLPAVGRRYPYMQHVSVDFGRMGKHDPCPMLTTALLHSTLVSYTCLTSLSISNFSTAANKQKSGRNWLHATIMRRLMQQQPVLCDLGPLHLAPHLTRLSLNPSPQQHTSGVAMLTWQTLCTLPKLDRLERLEIRNVEPPLQTVRQLDFTFPISLPALTHLTLHSNGYDQDSLLLALLKQHTALRSLEMGRVPRVHINNDLIDWLANHMHSLQALNSPFISSHLKNVLLAHPALAEIKVRTVCAWVDESDRLPACRKLCITDSELMPHQIITLLDTCPGLEHLEVKLGHAYHGWGHLDSAEEKKASWAQCGRMMHRLLCSKLRYLRLDVKYRWVLSKMIVPFKHQLEEQRRFHLDLLVHGCRLNWEDMTLWL